MTARWALPLCARISAVLVFTALLVACGSDAKPPALHLAGPPRLHFDYDRALPLHYVDHGRVAGHPGPIAVHDVSFTSDGTKIDGYLVLPPGRGRRPAVVVVHGSGGDRRELLSEAEWLAARNVVVLTITEPSTSSPPAPASAGPAAILGQLRDRQVRDVIAIRRAVDALRSLRVVDPRRIGYLGWSAGAKTGAFVAASE
ncbi:MAG: hypothetical protein WAU41_09770, partial [Gaiellaceae bacterium]